VPGDLILPLALEGENLGSRATFNPGKQAQRAKERTSIRSHCREPPIIHGARRGSAERGKGETARELTGFGWQK
jgi:hypothetical protein